MTSEVRGRRSALRLSGLSKTFPGQQALKGVELELHHGEVRALLGENGSGKSTLIKILAGRHQPDPGASAWIGDKPLQLGSAAAARIAGIRFIHQDLGLVSTLSVIDNLALGGTYVGRRWLNNRTEAAAARRLLSRYGVDLDVYAPVGALSPAEQTIVAIVRALRDGVEDGVLVLDEPTATLSAREIDRLFDVIRNTCSAGTAVLYVTHRMQEVFEIVDHVTVLRDGKVVADADVKSLTEESLVEAMIGRPLEAVFAEAPHRSGEVVLAADRISGDRLRSFSLSLHRGEVVGVAGVEGSGREELPQLLFGARRWHSGEMSFCDRRLQRMTIRDAMTMGMGYAGHRDKGSATRSMLVRENLTLPAIPTRGPAKWLSNRHESKSTQPWLERFDVRPADPERPLGLLSGGNQQKVVLARWLRCGSRILVLEDPTRGVDIGAKAGIYRIMAEAASTGTSFIVVSSDAEELAAVCDRVLVLRDGKIASELHGPALTEDAIVRNSIVSHGGSS